MRTAVAAVVNAPIVQLAVRKVGLWSCRHTYALVPFRGRLFLRCSSCGQETQGLVVYTPLEGQEDAS